MATIDAVKPRPEEAGRAMTVRLAWGIGLSALSGALLLLSFPPYGVWPLAWIGFVPYVFAQYRLMPFKWSSAAVALANLVWLGPFLYALFGTQVGFFFTWLGVWIALFNLLVSKERNFQQITEYRWLVISGAVSFVGFEMIRATLIPLVATSAFIGYTQAKQAWLIQPISIFSVYGLDLLMLLVNYSLALALMAWHDSQWAVPPSWRRLGYTVSAAFYYSVFWLAVNLGITFENEPMSRIRVEKPRPNLPVAVPVPGDMARNWLMTSGALLALWIALSLAMLGRSADTPTVRVAALRPNLPAPAFQDSVNTSQTRFDLFAGLARQASAQGARILYTPEMMFNFDPQAQLTDQFRALAKETGAYMFLSYTVSQEGQAWRNEAVLLTPGGEFLPVYGKNHAFGEPPSAMRGVYPVYDAPLGKLATLICHDANYTDVARKLTAGGAQLIAAPIHEFGGFGEQFWTNVLFRAVENRTAMVVTGAATVAAIINPDGSLVSLDTNRDGSQLVMVGDVKLGSGPTLYTHLGDILGWLAMAGFAFFMVYQPIVERRAKKVVLAVKA